MKKPILSEPQGPGEIVFAAAALLALAAAYCLYLALTTDRNDLATVAPYVGFYLFPASVLGVLGLIGGMLSGAWKPIPDSQARKRRIWAVRVGLGSLAIILAIFGYVN